MARDTFKYYLRPYLPGNSFYQGGRDLPFIKNRSLFNMNFKITQPVARSDRILLQFSRISPDLMDSFFQADPFLIFSEKEFPVKRTGHYLAAKISGVKTHPLFIAKTNQLDMKR